MTCYCIFTGSHNIFLSLKNRVFMHDDTSQTHFCKWNEKLKSNRYTRSQMWPGFVCYTNTQSLTLPHSTVEQTVYRFPHQFVHIWWRTHSVTRTCTKERHVPIALSSYTHYCCMKHLCSLNYISQGTDGSESSSVIAS